MDEDFQRLAIKQRLNRFYGNESTKDSTMADPLNIDGSNFDPRVYLEKSLKTKDLSDLMSEEKTLTEQIRSLDSDMQTLVYDNYSKFINATDTIRMMKTNFSYVQQEMNSLLQNIASIASLSSTIDNNLGEKRDNLKTLNATQLTLNKLHFLVELPSSLKIYTQQSKWESAVRDLQKAKFILKSYRNAPSFKTIREDCSELVKDISNKLWQKFDQSNDAGHCANYLSILLRLGFSRSKISKALIRLAKHRILGKLTEMRTQLTLLATVPDINKGATEQILCTQNPVSLSKNGDNSSEQDILHFTNLITDIILTELMAYLNVYSDLFFTNIDEDDPTDSILNIISNNSDHMYEVFDYIQLESQLTDLIEELMHEFFIVVRNRFEMEDSSIDIDLLIRALDRIYSRVQTFNRTITAIVGNLDVIRQKQNYSETSFIPETVGSRLNSLTEIFSNYALDLIIQVARAQTTFYFDSLCQNTIESITELRHKLASRGIQTTAYQHESSFKLNKSEPECWQLLTFFDNLSAAFVSQLKHFLKMEEAFLSPETSFSSKTKFRDLFCTDQIREGLIVGYLNFLVNFLDDLARTAISKIPAPILLILAKLCLNWVESGTIGHLISIADEFLSFSIQKRAFIEPELQLFVEASETNKSLTNAEDVANRFKETGNKLLVAFVRIEGTNLAQLLRKSVEARDWMKSLEPRSVRSVVKRVIEDLSVLDLQIGQLFTSGNRSRDRVSDSRSSRSLRPSGSSHFLDAARSAGSNQRDTNGTELDPALATHLHRLFTQRVDIFSPVEANRESLLLGVIKIGLKTLIECVRLQTFGRFGLQQIQVDCRYLQIHLWRFVNDEKVICMLLDDVIYSVIQRSIDSHLMEESIVEAICDRV